MQLSHYRVENEIGRGGMGVVYRAVDTRLGRAVAIKMLPQEATADAERRARFIQEARAASALNHPHIVTIYDVGEQDGATFIAMEVNGRDDSRRRSRRRRASIRWWERPSSTSGTSCSKAVTCPTISAD